ncbi:MAG: chemotaxis protein CheA, partial [Bacteroidota bacterium]|nr:chemotaxis protein CheA [Bacteroidota bacterium]
NTVLMKKYILSSEDASKPELEKETEKVTEIAQSAAKETADVQNAPKDHNAPVVQSIISVNVDKVDTLMDLIGELVIAESMVTQNPDLADLPLENFKNASRQLHKITNDLQDLAMSIRLVPLKPTFQKMSRIVRDMSKKLDKNVQLKMVGDDTEVDKNIIDHISDPLMHLVRNSLDHGIESAEERKASGKPVVASVTLEAKNDGGEVVVAVTDDGKGLNKEKILKRARENNLLTKPESELTDKEIYSMIFLPGFSTNDNVTEFSGRGVGMDVVLKNIEAVNGRVSVDSMPGIGTRTTIRFPLTLSIIEGMSIRVGSAKYAVPITSIRESFKPQERDLIKDPDGNEMILYRGRCYPILRLHEIYHTESDTQDFTQGIMMMVENGDKMVCLFADELIGEHQVVVKPLPRYIKSIKGVAGCTLLGDGSISLILDISSLIEMSQQPTKKSK